MYVLRQEMNMEWEIWNSWEHIIFKSYQFLQEKIQEINFSSAPQQLWDEVFENPVYVEKGHKKKNKTETEWLWEWLETTNYVTWAGEQSLLRKYAKT